MSDYRFDDRVAIITGAGGGLGRTYALELGLRGAKVVVNDLGGATDGTGGGSSMADQTVKEINEAGGTAVANYDSVATPEGGEAIVQTALDHFGQVDAVINNAGILRDVTFAKLPPKDLEAVIDVHLKGAFYVSQPAFRVMKERGYGRFLFTSSASGIFGNFGQTNYGAAKMGLVGLSNVLALEGAKYNIRSNVLAPAAGTRMTQELMGPMADKLVPEFVTPLAVFLVSEANESTHEIYSAGGGRYARIFVGLTSGWSSAEVPSVEDLAAHMDAIRSEEGYSVPGSANDELKLIAELSQGTFTNPSWQG